MPDKIASYALPDNFECPSCSAVLVGASPVTGGPPRGFRKGHLSVCGHCGSFLIMGDSMFRQLEPEEFNKLPVSVKTTLATIRQQVKARIANEKDKEN